MNETIAPILIPLAVRQSMMGEEIDMEKSGPVDPCCDNPPVLEKIHELYHTLLDHNGFGELRMDIRILKRGQKEVIIHCGKQYRFIVDAPGAGHRETGGTS